MIRKLLITGIFTGFIAGIILSSVQYIEVLPLILEAEVYETQSALHYQEQHAQWAPSDDNERSFFTLMNNILLGIGFSLVIISLMTLNQHRGWRAGLIWGLAGYCALFLAPSLGLPPELPGTPHADLEYRQIWWLGTVILTAIGLSLIFFNSNLSFRILGLLLLITPHFFSSLVATDTISQLPEDLSKSYIIATTISNLIFWLVIGASNGLLNMRFNISEKIQKNGF